MSATSLFEIISPSRPPPRGRPLRPVPSHRSRPIASFALARSLARHHARHHRASSTVRPHRRSRPRDRAAARDPGVSARQSNDLARPSSPDARARRARRSVSRRVRRHRARRRRRPRRRRDHSNRIDRRSDDDDDDDDDDDARRRDARARSSVYETRMGRSRGRVCMDSRIVV